VASRRPRSSIKEVGADAVELDARGGDHKAAARTVSTAVAPNTVSSFESFMPQDRSSHRPMTGERVIWISPPGWGVRPAAARPPDQPPPSRGMREIAERHPVGACHVTLSAGHGHARHQPVFAPDSSARRVEISVTTAVVWW
jgi:hypothetical protein